MAIPVVEFQVKNGNFKTRDFSPLIERVLAGVNLVMPGPQNVLPLYFSKTISYDNNYSNLSNNDFYLKTQD